MAGVLIFIPEVRNETEAQQRLLDLDMASLECSSLRTVIENGPNGGHGVVGLVGSEGIPAVRPEQEWQKAADAEVYFAIDGGYSPGTLQRERIYSGGIVTLLDGNQWQVPILHLMPSKYDLDADGNPVQVLRTPYQAFFKRTLDMVARLESDPPTIREWFDYGCDALAWNYRLERRMVAFLGLFDNDAVLSILMTSCEAEEALKIINQKKTE